MHMSDALASPAVATTAAVIALGALFLSARKMRVAQHPELVPLMGVMGAFVFAAQMINFAIPGAPTSGHIVGGVLLAAILGPWAAYWVLASVLVVQAFVFADGGILALGCNLLNMGFFTCIVAYPLLFRQFYQLSSSFIHLLWLTVITSVVGLLLGAVAVAFETALSGVTLLPLGTFLLFMLPVHLVIGVIEGVATAGVLYFIQQTRPTLLECVRHEQHLSATVTIKVGRVVGVFALITALLAVSFSWIASQEPDGLEWSILKTAGQALPAPPHSALMPGYNDPYLSGILGSVLVLLLVWLGVTLCRLYVRRSREQRIV